MSIRLQLLGPENFAQSLPLTSEGHMVLIWKRYFRLECRCEAANSDEWIKFTAWKKSYELRPQTSLKFEPGKWIEFTAQLIQLNFRIHN